MDSVMQRVIGPTGENVVYLIIAPTGSVQYVGSTRNIKRRKSDLDGQLRYMPSDCVAVTVGPFATRAEAYQVEDRLLGLLTPPLNRVHFVPRSLLYHKEP